MKIVGAIVFVLALAVVVLLLVRARPEPEPFDPRSGRPDGARGFVVVLERLGTQVSVSRTVPDAGVDPERDDAGTVIVLDDRLDADQRVALVEFAEAGGFVIVADPSSSLHGGSGPDGGSVEVVAGPLPERRLPVEAERNLVPGGCTIGELSGLRGVYVPDGLLFPVGPTEPRCFGREDTNSFVVLRSVGAGTIVGLGDNEIFTNRLLRRADNAGLAVGLVDIGRSPHVTILLGNGVSPTIDDIGTGDDTLIDLVPTWVWMTLALGVAAFVVFAISRSARVGRIVAEPPAVPIAGSELVSATGNLMQRAGHAERAGRLILGGLHRDLCRVHGVAVTAPLDELDRAVTGPVGVEAGEIERVLRSSAHDDGELLALSRRVSRLRHVVFDDAHPDRRPDHHDRRPDQHQHDPRHDEPDHGIGSVAADDEENVHA